MQLRRRSHHYSSTTNNSTAGLAKDSFNSESVSKCSGKFAATARERPVSHKQDGGELRQKWARKRKKKRGRKLNDHRIAVSNQCLVAHLRQLAAIRKLQIARHRRPRGNSIKTYILCPSQKLYQDAQTMRRRNWCPMQANRPLIASLCIFIAQLQSLNFVIFSLLSFTVINGGKLSQATSDYCYSDIGCFPLTAEFYDPVNRPINVRPWNRRRIKTTFTLFNKRNLGGFEIRAWDDLSLLYSNFDFSVETKVLIPGWLDNIHRTLWVKKARDAFLWLWPPPVNVLVINWTNFTPYTIATANSRVVGAEIANLIKFIENKASYQRGYYHLIGHSLGAHIAGYCGDRVPGLGRITALDPARPFFQDMPKGVRLDKGDAKFVDAIHSDFTPENAIFLLMSFGMTKPVGHVDFYPNGPPLLQPGCLRDAVFAVQDGVRKGMQHSSVSVAFMESTRYLIACDHQRSHEWFVESLTNKRCLFTGIRCPDFEGLLDGRCGCDDSRSACAIMGIHADQMYLNGAHEDLWPASYQRLRRPSLIGLTRNEQYAQLKHQAQILRQTQMLRRTTTSSNETATAASADSLVSAVPATSKVGRHSYGATIAPDDGILIEMALAQRNNHEPSINTHPKQISDLDKSIEQWYEGESRWFLKTNNRPEYCVNQYQVLVFLGPTGFGPVQSALPRANLLISIIGSSGRLINQRFVPRSQTLEPLTMQPFFVILEGAYTLGDIKSVSLAWEERREPSDALANTQLTYQTHSVLPNTIRAPHDTSDAFRHQAATVDAVAAAASLTAGLLTDSSDYEYDYTINTGDSAGDQLLPHQQQFVMGRRRRRGARETVPILTSEPKERRPASRLGYHFFEEDLLFRHIRVSQVQISAVEASYGRYLTTRTFCPPQPNQALGLRRTMRMTASLSGSCGF